MRLMFLKIHILRLMRVNFQKFVYKLEFTVMCSEKPLIHTESSNLL